MIIADAVVSGAVGLCSSGVVVAFVQSVFNRGPQRAEAAARKAEAVAREHETWFDEAEDAYTRVRKECDVCNEKLDRITNAFYGLLDDLEEEIIPMLILPHADPRMTSRAVRVCMRKARDRVTLSKIDRP